MRNDRRDPDALLKHLLEEERAATRGRLKIYLGMAAGVGKTYSMLSDAIVEKERGVDIILGYLEPHGRAETEALGTRFERVPLRDVEYRGVHLSEVDTAAIIRRQPQTVLIDELPHTNAPGSRHAKRWEDIEELLAAGINVATTVNIQHLESLRDVVAQITGIAVQETVPDSFLANADEIELVDITPEELLQRLESGKIYKPEKIDGALKNFFQKGHLIALRELLLRRAADTVDVQLQSLRRAQGAKNIWPTTPRVLVAVGPTRFASKLVRAAARLAFNLRAELVAVNVSTPREIGLSPEARALAARALSLAESLGAETVQSAADDIGAELIHVAREKNANVIVIGKPLRLRFRDYFFGSPVDELIRKSGDIDIYVVRAEKEDPVRRQYAAVRQKITSYSFAMTTLALAIATGICFLIYPAFELSNLIMVYLLGTAWVAATYSRREAVFAAIASVFLFDFFFVPPRWTFAVSDIQYAVTFAVMLVIGLLISTLTLRRREQAHVVLERERRTSALYELTRRLAIATTLDDVAAAAERQVALLFPAKTMLLHPSGADRLEPVRDSDFHVPNDEKGVAAWASQHGKTAGKGTDTLPGANGTYFPLNTGKLSTAVLGVFAEDPLDFDQIQILEAISHLLASSIGRIEQQAEAQASRVKVEREEVRNLLLSSVSHDLRTPLAAIAGSASVVLADPALSPGSRDLVRDISNESSRLGLIVRNILDLTRLESGDLELNQEWQSVEELVGIALERTASLLGTRTVQLHLPAGLPLLHVDGLLLEQLLINLFENAGRHTPENTRIEVSARLEPDWVVIEIADNGPGVIEGQEDRIFERLFTASTRAGGTGLGLTICRAIAEAHGGSISASNRASGGACFVIKLPREKSQPEVVHD